MDFEHHRGKIKIDSSYPQKSNEGFFNGRNAEHRTLIRYESEEHSAPALFKLQGEAAKIIFESLEFNTSVISLKVNGNQGKTACDKPS
jgi:hypothetical protein